MKILIISHLYPSVKREYYGTFVHEQVKELKKLDIELKVVSPVKLSPFPLNRISEKWKGYAEIPFSDVYDSVHVTYPRYLSLPRNIAFDKSGLLMYKSIRKQILKMHQQEKFDMIHAHVALPDGFAAYLLSKEIGIPYVLTVHGQDLQKTVKLSSECKKQVGFTLEHASKVIYVSSKLKKLESEIFPDVLVNEVIIPNGVSQKWLNVKKDKARSDANFNGSGPRLLSVSNLYFEKGIQDNIVAVSKLVAEYPDLQYIVVGDGPEREKLEGMAKKLGIERNVVFKGAFKPNHVIEIMNECDVFSLPSFNEAFGIVYIEAMACAKPVIACRGEGPEDYITSGLNGFLMKPRDTEELTEILRQLFLNPTQRSQVAENARTLIENEYNWNSAAKKIKDVYLNTLNRVEK
ncbi:glycosyltransferase [Mesobacillus jeotgali]|uniref:Glycosyltransferase n=1 Tax=Mesobacillus jeotgali TaxID=129985 RepID=A0ABY9VLQ9_9BACI|nr:glycosyltransferase [Mesobacillus jeotgali]WNF22637.1 glycosyltransferase [Mesobacillus jeotgali]